MFYKIRGLIILIAIGMLVSLSASPAVSDVSSSERFMKVDIFNQAEIGFSNEDTKETTGTQLVREDNGRVVVTKVRIPAYVDPVRITAHLVIYPIPKDGKAVCDPWDRAGNIRLSKDGMPDIEVVKFVTAYGGQTSFDVDITQLAPLLWGECTFKAFIDTWVNPGWKIDFSLNYKFDRIADDPNWVQGLTYLDSYTKESHGERGIETEITVPESLNRISIYYLVSGHCTDGTDADEFISKDNIICVDEKPVYRFKPWRDDCRNFRNQNPFTRKWSDDEWSSDYSRSGWCPGDVVQPLVLDLSTYLTPGKHKVRFVIEDVRPKDSNGHYGYWRISSYLVGWTDKK